MPSTKNEKDSGVYENPLDEAIEAIHNITMTMNVHRNLDENHQDNQETHRIKDDNVLNILLILQDVTLF